MKKPLTILLVLLMLTGCSKKITCGECHQTKKGQHYTLTALGMTIEEDVCDDCIKNIKSAASALGLTVK